MSTARCVLSDFLNNKSGHISQEHVRQKTVIVIDVLIVYGSQFRHVFEKGLYELGKSSYGIYLLHSTVLMFFARAFQKYTPWILAYPPLFLLVLVALAVGVPFLLMRVVARSPLRRSYRYLFG